MTSWPVLTPERRGELAAKAGAAAAALREVADVVTHYAGGGAPAHEAREAASYAERARQRIAEL